MVAEKGRRAEEENILSEPQFTLGAVELPPAPAQAKLPHPTNVLPTQPTALEPHSSSRPPPAPPLPPTLPATHRSPPLPLEASRSMSLDSEYLAETYTNVRARRIGWEAAARGGAVTDAQAQRIKSLDKVPRSQRKDVVEREPQAYAEVVREVLRNSQEKNRNDVVQYMLVWTADLLAGESSRAEL